MIPLTFLGSSRPLVKTFSPQGSINYPNIKNFNSYKEEVNTIRELHTTLSAHGRHGQCLLKGELERELKFESRKGLVKKDAPTRLFVLDIDGVEITSYRHGVFYDTAEITRVAENILGLLPEEFQNTSYVVQPSSSFGVKETSVSLHYFFLLNEQVSPARLKNYILSLNVFCPRILEQTKLTASGSALSYRIDPSIIDNSRLIYIAPPIFEGITDPIPSPEDRFILIEKRAAFFPVKSILELDESKVKNKVQKVLRDLRIGAGLSGGAAKTQRMLIGTQVVDVVTTPDTLNMTFYSDNGDFVTYDINGGDSHAYYVHKYNPTIVYNFKGEPNFLFEAADPETYYWHRTKFIQNPENMEGLQSKKLEIAPEPLVFRDFLTDQYHNGLVNPVSGEIISMAAASKTGFKGLKDFMTQHGNVMGETVPVWDYKFDPQSNVGIDYEKRFLNRYQQPEIYSQIGDLQPSTIDQDCPTVVKILKSVVGGDEECYAYLLNWIAFIVQTKKKTNTAWIFQGVQGTGKGQMYARILTPLMGNAYARMMTLENVEEQFNSYLQDNLLLVIDEFRLQDSRSYDKLMNKIKNIITEPFINIRKMHTNAFEIPSYSNVMFFSNMYDVLRIEESDRRFNVAPRQETPLVRQHPGIRFEIETKLDAEIPFFARHMVDYAVDHKKACTAMDNDAKQKMHVLSVNSVQQIADAFRHGALDFFIEHIMHKDPLENSFVMPAQNIVKAIINKYQQGAETKLRSQEAQILYAGITNTRENGIKFGRMMGLHGLEAKQVRLLGVSCKGYTIHWDLPEGIDPVELRAVYCKEMKQFDTRVTPLTKEGY